MPSRARVATGTSASLLSAPHCRASSSSRRTPRGVDDSWAIEAVPSGSCHAAAVNGEEARAVHGPSKRPVLQVLRQPGQGAWPSTVTSPRHGH
eukprot:scaffold7601_cov417-Prasinococcus_capsulatus_cf.AAC.12